MSGSRCITVIYRPANLNYKKGKLTWHNFHVHLFDIVNSHLVCVFPHKRQEMSMISVLDRNLDLVVTKMIRRHIELHTDKERLYVTSEATGDKYMILNPLTLNKMDRFKQEGQLMFIVDDRMFIKDFTSLMIVSKSSGKVLGTVKARTMFFYVLYEYEKKHLFLVDNICF